MCEGLVAVEWYVLVCVCGLAVDIEVKGTVSIADDCHIEHGNSAVHLSFFGPLYVWMYGVQVVVE